MSARLACFGAEKIGFYHWDLGLTNEKTSEKLEWDLDLNMILEIGMGFLQKYYLDWEMGLGHLQNPALELGFLPRMQLF